MVSHQHGLVLCNAVEDKQWKGLKQLFERRCGKCLQPSLNASIAEELNVVPRNVTNCLQTAIEAVQQLREQAQEQSIRYLQSIHSRLKEAGCSHSDSC